MPLSELAALARRHILALSIVFIVTLGIAYEFKHTKPAYTETSTVALGVGNSNGAAYQSSLITTGQIVVIWISGAQGKQQLADAGVGSNFTVSLVNSQNLDQPQYSNPYLTVSETNPDAATTHKDFSDGMKILLDGIVELQSKFHLPTGDHVTARMLADSGPVAQIGSESRSYGALAFLGLVAAYVTSRSLDNRAVRSRRRDAMQPAE